jgi:hypothetical protein
VRRGPRRPGLPILGIAVGGLLVAHALSYLIAVPDAKHRGALLAHTGHAYLPSAARITLLLVLVSAATAAARVFWDRSDRSLPGFGALAARLALIQATAFVSLEVAERWMSGTGYEDLVRDHVLVIGVAAQVLVALLGAAFLRWLARVAVRAASLVIQPRARSRPSVVFAPPIGVGLPPAMAALTGSVTVRAPPHP